VQGPDCWGFSPNSGKESAAMYLMRALEAGDKTKDTIRSEYSYDFAKPVRASEKQSTFDVFFSDVVGPFGHAQQSRSLIIREDEQKRLYIDPTRAQMAKDAVKKGILQRIKEVPGTFPPDKNKPDKKDLRVIEAIRDEFRVPSK
jgi:hypothetical protein